MKLTTLGALSLACAGLVFSGCGNTDVNSGGVTAGAAMVAPPGSVSSVAAGQAALDLGAAKAIVGLALKYAQLQLQSPGDYVQALTDHAGCAVWSDFSQAMGNGDPQAGLAGLVAELKASGTAINSEELAGRATASFAKAFGTLTNLCVSQNVASVSLARQLIASGMVVRSALGLPVR